MIQPNQMAIVALLAGASIVGSPIPAQANCPNPIASLETVQPYMERHWQTLKQRTDFPWGSTQPYGTIQGDRLTLTPAFEPLSGAQKQQVLHLLHLGDGKFWQDLLTPEEQQIESARSGIGGASPYTVFASDGRALSLPYDGCGRGYLFTEQQRFSWYLGRPPGVINPDDLRNAGSPFWRTVNYPLSVDQERDVRLHFWRVVGYKNANSWWIAWVPEHGYFEINVPSGQSYGETLQRFWRVKFPNYRYVVVESDGTTLNVDPTGRVRQSSISSPTLR